MYSVESDDCDYSALICQLPTYNRFSMHLARLTQVFLRLRRLGVTTPLEIPLWFISPNRTGLSLILWSRIRGVMCIRKSGHMRITLPIYAEREFFQRVISRR